MRLDDVLVLVILFRARYHLIQLMDLIKVEIEQHKAAAANISIEISGDVEKEDDKSFENNVMKVVVDKKSYLYLLGTTLDFSGGLNGKGFVFQNPNAGRTCGCGESFSV